MILQYSYFKYMLYNMCYFHEGKGQKFEITKAPPGRLGRGADGRHICCLQMGDFLSLICEKMKGLGDSIETFFTILFYFQSFVFYLTHTMDLQAIMLYKWW